MFNRITSRIRIVVYEGWDSIVVFYKVLVGLCGARMGFINMKYPLQGTYTAPCLACMVRSWNKCKCHVMVALVRTHNRGA